MVVFLISTMLSKKPQGYELSIKCDSMSLPKLYGPQLCSHCLLVSIETSQRKESLTTKLEMTYELVIPGLPKFKQFYVYSASSS